MMYGFGSVVGFGIFGILFSFVLLVDLILVGIWLWQQIQKQ